MLRRRSGWIEVSRAGRMIFATDLKPRLAQLAIGERLAFMLPPRLRKPARLRTSEPIVTATQNGAALPLEGSPTELRFRPTGSKPEPVEILFAETQKDRRAARA